MTGRAAVGRVTILSGPILPTMFRLSWPTVLVFLGQTAVNVAEALYVGRLGTAALAGVALVFPFYMLMSTLSGGGLGSGVASAVARAHGANDTSGADDLVLHAIVLALVIGGAFTTLAFVFGRSVYYALGGRGEALAAAVTYSNTVFAGSVGVWAVNLMAAALRGSGNVKLPATVTFVGALVMVPASPVLIFGFGPVPRLGIAGAGATLAAYYAVAALVLLRHLASGRSSLRLRLRPLRLVRFAVILRVGLPAALSTAQTNVTAILVTGATGLLGTDALAGYGIASRLDYVMVPLLFGAASAVLTMVGINVGAGQAARGRTIARRSSMACAVVAEVIGLAVAGASMNWVRLFSQDPRVVGPAITYLHAVAPAYGFLAFGFVLSFAAQGAGRIAVPLAAVSVRLLVAAGLGWVAVLALHRGMVALAAIVAVSFVAYAAVCSLVVVLDRIWTKPASKQ